MSGLISVTIDGKECKAKEGEFILNVARANGIFIPALCYVTRCTPTLACRVCLVEADGKQVYGCNAKVKEGMDIKTVTENIVKERRAIMEVYDVNHPLQCGVCDQSGECELQNYSLYMKVDSQSYAVKDVNRPAQDWGVMKYDPGLCIVCEKCVTICKDMIGSNALSTVKRGADALDANFKATMPKDAYSMWNKLNKSLIGFEEDKCTDCGECISVCPVGALVSSDFQYKSNAWELTKIPAANPHGSDCSLIYYEVKHQSIENNQNQIIYRVTNDSHYTSLSGSTRFGYDFENRVASKDVSAFEKAVEAFKSCETIKFNSFITNEEALILQKIKEKLGVKLVNNDAYAYKTFMDSYSSVTGKLLYGGDVKKIHDSNFLISVGSFLKSDHPTTRYAFNNAISMNKGAGLYFHPIGDPIVEGFGKKGKTIETIAHNPLAEESVLYFILDQFGENLPETISNYLSSFRETRTKTVVENVKETVVEMVKDEETGESKEVKKVVPKKVETQVEFTYTKLLENINSDESLLELIESMLDKKDTFSLIIGEDIISHPNAKNLAYLCGLIEKYTKFDIVVIPTQTNTLGVSLICDLDPVESGSSVGYNVAADFQLSALGDGDLDMPALNQQEGTFTNIDKRVVPTNAALPYNGYELNDIAKALGIEVDETIDYTAMLPVSKGYSAVEFDTLPNCFKNDRTEDRGYLLNNIDTAVSSEDKVVDILNQEVADTIIYRANPINQVNEFTQKAHELNEETALYLSTEGSEHFEVNTGDIVTVHANNHNIKLKVIIDNQINGKIGYISTFDKKIETEKLFGTYRFNQAVIEKV